MCLKQGTAGPTGKRVAVSALSVAVTPTAEVQGGSYCNRGRWHPQAGSGGVVMQGWGGALFQEICSVGVSFRDATLDGTVWRSHACPQL